MANESKVLAQNLNHVRIETRGYAGETKGDAYKRRISQWSERDKIITPCPHTPTLQSRDDKMIREAMSEIYDNEYDAVVATVRVYAIAFMGIITLIVGAMFL